MKIEYKFVTGETTEVEVSEEIGAMIIASREAERALERQNRCHCCSLHDIDSESLAYSKYDEYPDDPAEQT